MTSCINPRLVAYQVLIEYSKKHSDPVRLLYRYIPQNENFENSNLAWELALGTIKMKKKLDFIIQHFVKSELRKIRINTLSLLRLGFYQLIETKSIPEYTAVDETIKLAKDFISQKETGFINAVMRSYLRKPDNVKFPDKNKKPIEYLSNFYSYPEWLAKRWLERYGFEETENILIAFNKRPKTSFRIINSKSGTDYVINELKKSNINFERNNHFPDYISVENTTEILRSDLFKRGYLNPTAQTAGKPDPLPSRGREKCDNPIKNAIVKRILGGAYKLEITLEPLSP